MGEQSGHNQQRRRGLAGLTGVGFVTGPASEGPLISDHAVPSDTGTSINCRNDRAPPSATSLGVAATSPWAAVGNARDGECAEDGLVTPQ